MASDDHVTSPDSTSTHRWAGHATYFPQDDVGGGAVRSPPRWRASPGAWAAGSDEIRIGLIGAGGRGTGAVQTRSSRRRASAWWRWPSCSPIGSPTRARPWRTRSARPRRPERSRVHRPRRLPEGARRATSTTSSWRRRRASVRAPRGGDRGRQAHLHREAGRRRRAGHQACLSLVDDAAQKKLLVGGGLQRHHQQGYLETMKRIHDGAIGDIVAARVYWNQGALWNRGRKPEWTDIEWQMRNWYYFTWLCGDHIVEQHIHNIDVINWAMKGHPVRATGIGGRQVRTGPECGPHLRPLRRRLRVRERRPPVQHVPPAGGHRRQRVRGAGRQQGPVPGERLQDHRAQRLRRHRHQAQGAGPVPAGARRLHRLDPQGRAAQRAEVGRPSRRRRRSWAARPPTPARW